ncbi:hypothetical protein, partial [Clavibacter michiganensis]|uniref:hypothetical protein n=1 Tax=Clavibacter michiganensis TaxID=28447 RepID=UPI00292E3FC8
MLKKIIIVVLVLALIVVLFVAWGFRNLTAASKETTPIAHEWATNITRAWDPVEMEKITHPGFVQAMKPGQTLKDFTD